MKTFKMKSLATAAAAAALGLGMASSAHALQYNVTLYEVGNEATNFYNTTVVDGGAGDSDGGSPSQHIALSLATASPAAPAWLSGYSVTGSNASYSESANNSFMQTGSSSVVNSANKTIRAFVVVTHDQFTGPRNYGATSSSVTIAPATTTTLTNYFFNDPNGGLPITGTIANIGDFNTFVTGLKLDGSGEGTAGYLIDSDSFSASGSSSANFGPAALVPPDIGPFAMSLVFDFTLDNGESIISRGMSIEKNVPEPMTMSLLGAGLVGLGAARRRKAKAKEQGQVQA